MFQQEYIDGNELLVNLSLLQKKILLFILLGHDFLAPQINRLNELIEKETTSAFKTMLNPFFAIDNCIMEGGLISQYVSSDFKNLKFNNDIAKKELSSIISFAINNKKMRPIIDQYQGGGYLYDDTDCATNDFIVSLLSLLAPGNASAGFLCCLLLDCLSLEESEKQAVIGDEGKINHLMDIFSIDNIEGSERIDNLTDRRAINHMLVSAWSQYEKSLMAHPPVPYSIRQAKQDIFLKIQTTENGGDEKSLIKPNQTYKLKIQKGSTIGLPLGLIHEAGVSKCPWQSQNTYGTSYLDHTSYGCVGKTFIGFLATLLTARFCKIASQFTITNETSASEPITQKLHFTSKYRTHFKLHFIKKNDEF
ncbi:MAG: hypothetical protein HAW62_01485 [Endozoicomonadaceae bacterium]|nr:hypothetical protein [Endozoicomonadaceae bacterium]